MDKWQEKLPNGKTRLCYGPDHEFFKKANDLICKLEREGKGGDFVLSVKEQMKKGRLTGKQWSALKKIS